MTGGLRITDPPDGDDWPDDRVEPRVSPPHWAYREIFLLAAITLAGQMAATGAAIQVLARVAGLGEAAALEALRGDPLVAVPVQMLAWLPALAYIVYVVTRRYGQSLADGLAWARLPRPVTAYVRIGVLLAIGSTLLAIAFHDPGQHNPMQDLFARREGLWLLATFGILAAPLIEEIVFRGFLYGALEHRHNSAVALGASTVVFASLHGSQYAWQWPQLGVLVAVGCSFGIVRMHTGSTKASTIVHAAYNGLLFLFLVSLPEGLV